MIIRCSNCNSAYAVNDSKVENKKFAFNCPNCSAENIIDNRIDPVGLAAAAGGVSQDSDSGGMPPQMEYQGQEESSVLTEDTAMEGVSDETDIMGESSLEFDEETIDGLGAENEELLEESTPEEIKSTQNDTAIEEAPAAEETSSADDLMESADSPIVEEEFIPGETDEPPINLEDSGDLTDEEFLSENPEIDSISGEEDIVAHEESLDLSDAEDLDFSLEEEAASLEAGQDVASEEPSLEDAEDLGLDLDFEDAVDDSTELDFSLDETGESEESKIVQDELGDELAAKSDTIGGPDDLSDIDTMSEELQNEILDESEISSDLGDMSDIDTQLDSLDNELAEESEVISDLDDISDIDTQLDNLDNELAEDSEVIPDLDDLPDPDTLLNDLDNELAEDSKFIPDLDDLPDIDTELDGLENELAEKPGTHLHDEVDFQPVEDEASSHEIGSELDDSFPIVEGEDSVPGIDGIAHTESELEEDDSITIDLDSLDIELEEGDDIVETPAIEEELEIDIPENVEEEIEIDIPENVEEQLEIDIPGNAEKELVVNIDSDIDLVDLYSDSSQGKNAEPDAGVFTESSGIADAAEEDENITIDLDSLDLDLDESSAVMAEGEKPDGIVMGEEFQDTKVDEIDTQQVAQGEENITLDLDSLDIPVEESSEVLTGESIEEDEKLTLEDAGLTMEELTSGEAIVASGLHEDEDEDIKLTMEDAGLTMEELTSEEAIVSSALHDELDEDIKLTMEDAGLTMEELTSGEAIAASGQHEEVDDDIKLTIDEIDPSLNLDNIGEELSDSGQSMNLESDNKIPEGEFLDISDDEFDEFIPEEQGVKETFKGGHVDDSLIELEDEEPYRGFDKAKSKKDMIRKISKGSVNFSLDYSLKYSRMKALLRLLGIYYLGMIPHIIVYFVYNILSVILGVLNQLIVFSTGSNIEDFSDIQENTIRYLLSIFASSVGIVDEYPEFAGREDIDYPLQLTITYPVRYSRIIAALRLSVVGILLINLPHWIILGLLTFAQIIIAPIGILSVLITGRWPHVLFDILSRYYRYYAKILAFTFGLVDSYPPFDFK